MSPNRIVWLSPTDAPAAFSSERMWGKLGELDERPCLVIIYIKYQQVRILNGPTIQTLVLILGQISTRVFLFALWRQAVV